MSWSAAGSHVQLIVGDAAVGRCRPRVGRRAGRRRSGSGATAASCCSGPARRSARSARRSPSSPCRCWRRSPCTPQRSGRAPQRGQQRRVPAGGPASGSARRPRAQEAGDGLLGSAAGAGHRHRSAGPGPRGADDVAALRGRVRHQRADRVWLCPSPMLPGNASEGVLTQASMMTAMTSPGVRVRSMGRLRRGSAP